VQRHRESMDCLKRFRDRVKDERWLDMSELDAIDAQVLALIDRAVKQAQAASGPAESELTTDVYISY
jgi:TPP-dependent pyruvate/acetoin dehydrogenase alpha subunit